MPINFRSHRGGTPTKIGNRIRTMGKALPGPKAHLPRLGRRLTHTADPAAGAGLLLHNAKIRGDRAAACQAPGASAVVESARLLGVAVSVKCKIRVAVIGHKGKSGFRQFMTVQITENAICGDKGLLWDIAP